MAAVEKRQESMTANGHVPEHFAVICVSGEMERWPVSSNSSSTLPT